MTGRRRLGALVAMVGVAASVIVTSATVEPVQGAGYPDDLVWLALGDSYSSGEGLPKNDRGANPPDKDCQRGTGDTGVGDRSESRAYGVVAYDAVRGDLVDSTFRLLACTGAITNDVHQQYRDEWLNGGEPKADVVTISIGGNNVGFAKTIRRCIGMELDNSTGAGIFLNPAIGCDTNIDEQRSSVDQLIGAGAEGEQAPDGGQTLRDMYIEMASQAVHPGGHIVITGYPNLVEESGRWTLGWLEGNRCSRVRRSDTAMLRSAAGYLNEQIALLSQELSGTNDVSFSFIDTSQVYENDQTGRHGLCTGQPWINGLTFDDDRATESFNRSFHPTQRGHDALGAAVANVVQGLDWSDLRRQPPFTEAPAAIRRQPADCVTGSVSFADDDNNIADSAFNPYPNDRRAEIARYQLTLSDLGYAIGDEGVDGYFGAQSLNAALAEIADNGAVATEVFPNTEILPAALERLGIACFPIGDVIVVATLCGNDLESRPNFMFVNCAATQQIADIEWTEWTSSSAVGRGTYKGCASCGSDEITFELTAPERFGCGDQLFSYWVFSTLTLDGSSWDLNEMLYC